MRQLTIGSTLAYQAFEGYRNDGLRHAQRVAVALERAMAHMDERQRVNAINDKIVNRARKKQFRGNEEQRT